MPITTADVEKMLTIAASAGNMDLDSLVKIIYQQDEKVLPKMFQERAKELLVGKPVIAPKEKSVWARKSTKAYAAEVGVSEEEITIRTGQNGTIVLADVKTAYKNKKLANRTEKTKKKVETKEPERNTATEEPNPSNNVDDGDEFEDE